jgi:hypothetical protein
MRVFHDYTVDAEHQVILPTAETPALAGGPKRVVPGGEIYLRLLEVDLGDLDAISAFVNEFDILGVYDIENRWQWPYFMISAHGPERALLEAARRMAGIPVAEGEKADLASHGIPIPDDHVWADDERAGFEDEGVETLVEFRYGVRQIRDVVAAIRFLRGELSEGDLCWESPTAKFAATLRDSNELWLPGIRDFLRFFFDVGLEAFHPGITFLVDDEHTPTSALGTNPSGDAALIVEPSDSGRYEARLYSICCLEIYNHLIEQAPYRLCRNETCRRLFVRQSGRARYGQYRLRGTLYCSHTCAKAQAQRELRRRRRANMPSTPRDRAR